MCVSVCRDFHLQSLPLELGGVWVHADAHVQVNLAKILVIASRLVAAGTLEPELTAVILGHVNLLAGRRDGGGHDRHAEEPAKSRFDEHDGQTKMAVFIGEERR